MSGILQALAIDSPTNAHPFLAKGPALIGHYLEKLMECFHHQKDASASLRLTGSEVIHLPDSMLN